MRVIGNDLSLFDESQVVTDDPGARSMTRCMDAADATSRLTGVASPMVIGRRRHTGMLGARVQDRRGGPGNKGLVKALRRAAGMLRRPLGLQRQGLKLQVVFKERRRAEPAEPPPTLSELRADLEARLLAHSDDQTTPVLGHLIRVHRELGRKGWSGVEVLPSAVLDMALVQAEIFASEESSPAITMLVDRLRILKVAAVIREERKALIQAAETGTGIEVSEVTHEEFQESSRRRHSTMPGETNLGNSDQ